MRDIEIYETHLEPSDEDSLIELASPIAECTAEVILGHCRLKEFDRRTAFPRVC